MTPGKVVAAILAGTLALAGITLGGWEVGWWFKNQNIQRQSHLLRNSYANQQSLRDEITAKIGDVLTIGSQIASSHDPSEVAALKAQRVAIVNIVCGDAVQVTGDALNPSQQSFVALNCRSGVISLDSPYNQ